MRRFGRSHHLPASQRLIVAPRSAPAHGSRPPAAFRQRFHGESGPAEGFCAPEVWHEPTGRKKIRFITEPAGEGYIHPVTPEEVAERVQQLPRRFRRNLEVVQFSRMTRKRGVFPCYGMQWGSAVYLYPIEASLVETYARPPRPEQIVEARMFGAKWEQTDGEWQLVWTEKTIRDFYLNNVLIHEIGHSVDDRNTRFQDRERFANWFAVEYGYRVSRGRRS